LVLLPEVSEGLSRGSKKLRVRDRRFALFLSGETFCRGEKGAGCPGASKNPEGLVAEDPHHQSYRKSVSGSKEKD
jgi:hypothetical protein